MCLVLWKILRRSPRTMLGTAEHLLTAQARRPCSTNSLEPALARTLAQELLLARLLARAPVLVPVLSPVLSQLEPVAKMGTPRERRQRSSDEGARRDYRPRRMHNDWRSCRVACPHTCTLSASTFATLGL